PAIFTPLPYTTLFRSVVVRVAIRAFHFEAFGKRQAIEKGHDELAVEFRHLERGIDFRMLRYAARVRQLARDRQRVFPGGELLLPALGATCDRHITVGQGENRADDPTAEDRLRVDPACPARCEKP